MELTKVRLASFRLFSVFLLLLVLSALRFSHTGGAVLQFSSILCTGFERFFGTVSFANGKAKFSGYALRASGRKTFCF